MDLKLEYFQRFEVFKKSLARRMVHGDFKMKILKRSLHRLLSKLMKKD